MKPSYLGPLRRQLIATNCTRLTTSPALTSRSPATSLSTIINLNLNLSQRRTEVSLARTKRALKVPPHPSFVWPRRPSSAKKGAEKGEEGGEEEEEGDVIIFNPPSSAPSVYHTPYIFLPEGDPRRHDGIKRFFNKTDAENPGILSDNLAGVAAPPSPLPLPPEVSRPRRNPNYTLTLEQTQEMQRLRREDPARWSVQVLAKKFGCSPRWVQIAAPGSEEHRANLEKQLQRVKRRWGPRKTQARSEREKRRELLFSGRL